MGAGPPAGRGWPPRLGRWRASATTVPTEERVTDDLVRGWAPVYPHLRYAAPGAAIAWLGRVFGFRELARLARPDGTVITAKLEGPDGGLVMVAGSSPEFEAWLRDRVPGFRAPRERPWPHPSHTTTVLVGDVDAHYQRATAGGATILLPPTDQPWGLRAYAALDLEGHQWEFSQPLHPVEPEAWGATRIE
jgi:uncharacterized glyoxalase superfamily protein PhnB